jgi:hypothetical protein
MADKFKQIECGKDDVLSFYDNRTCKISTFTKAVYSSCASSWVTNFQEQLNNQGIKLAYVNDLYTWSNQGIDCEILNLGATKWKKGKVKIQVSGEFYAEEDEEILETSQVNQPESPLDDLRQKLNEVTQ